MKAQMDKTVEDLTDNSRPYEDVHRIRVITEQGTEFDISEERDTGELTVRTVYGTIVVLPRAANSIQLRAK